MSAITTFAPSPTKPRAKLAPIPRALPVTITVRLSKRFMIVSRTNRHSVYRRSCLCGLVVVAAVAAPDTPTRAVFSAAVHHSRSSIIASACFAIPLRINPVDGVLEHCRGSVVVFRGVEDEAVGLRDRGGPSVNNRVLEGPATRRGRGYWLIEERHWNVAQIE